ncbi:Pentatricopeptide repeat-containing protein [Acorus calamus]|uniref:Pentatricopeptide repeat-containing protein n=1 Tax=Acorus calamus TaxID=4465 RepID=A0AAV9ETL7_ACOCL|nr:Pentatricopeptide repeat-containing protein [Acorus calamus]
MEVLQCRSLIHIRQNRTHAQLDTQKNSYAYGNCVNCLYCVSGFSHVEAKTCRKLSIINGLSMESSFRELGYGCKISDLKRVLRPVTRVGCVTSASPVSGLVYEVVEAKSPTRSIEEQDVPPCGTSQICKEPNIEYNDDPRISSMSGTALHYLEERNEETLSKRILSLSRSNKVRSAMELYASMEASYVQPDIHAYNSFLSCLLRNGFEGDALRVFETMKKKGTTTGHSYSLILKAVASVRGCDSALKMFLEWESGGETRRVFDVIVYNTMLPMCGKEKNWVLAEKIWRIIKDDGYSGTSITYRLLVSTFVQCGQTELALDAYHEMIHKGLEPDRDTIKAIVATCTKEGKWSLALTVFEQMIKNGFMPDVISYNAMINCLGKAGETALAFKFLIS